MEALSRTMNDLELSTTSFCSDLVSRARPRIDQPIAHVPIPLVGKSTDTGATENGD